VLFSRLISNSVGLHFLLKLFSHGNPQRDLSALTKLAGYFDMAIMQCQDLTG